MTRTVRSLGLLFVLGATLAAAVPAAAADPSLRFRLGQFDPEGESEYWQDKEVDFTGEAADLKDLVIGGDLLWPIHRNASFMASLDHFQGELDQAYLDFVDAQGFDIVHSTQLTVTPLTAGLVLHLAPERSPVVPYLGAGGGFYFWRLRERGDFIDFGVVPAEVFTGTFEDEGQALGYYAVGGIEVPLGRYWAFLAEYRRDWADDDLSGDFTGLGELDLSGQRISGGFAWRF